MESPQTCIGKVSLAFSVLLSAMELTVKYFLFLLCLVELVLMEVFQVVHVIYIFPKYIQYIS